MVIPKFLLKEPVSHNSKEYTPASTSSQCRQLYPEGFWKLRHKDPAAVEVKVQPEETKNASEDFF